MQAFRDLRGGDPDDAAMPALTGDHRDVTVLRIFQLGDSEIDDLLLHRLALLVARVEMVRETARLFGIARIKELDHGTGRIHASGSVDSWPKPESEIVCCHALAVSATGYVDQRAQTGIRDAGQILQSDGYDRAVFAC